MRSLYFIYELNFVWWAGWLNALHCRLQPHNRIYHMFYFTLFISHLLTSSRYSSSSSSVLRNGRFFDCEIYSVHKTKNLFSFLLFDLKNESERIFVYTFPDLDVQMETKSAIYFRTRTYLVSILPRTRQSFKCHAWKSVSFLSRNYAPWCVILHDVLSQIIVFEYKHGSLAATFPVTSRFLCA